MDQLHLFFRILQVHLRLIPQLLKRNFLAKKLIKLAKNKQLLFIFVKNHLLHLNRKSIIKHLRPLLFPKQRRIHKLRLPLRRKVLLNFHKRNIINIKRNKLLSLILKYNFLLFPPFLLLLYLLFLLLLHIIIQISLNMPIKLFILSRNQIRSERTHLHPNINPSKHIETDPLHPHTVLMVALLLHQLLQSFRRNTYIFQFFCYQILSYPFQKILPFHEQFP